MENFIFRSVTILSKLHFAKFLGKHERTKSRVKLPLIYPL